MLQLENRLIEWVRKYCKEISFVMVLVLTYLMRIIFIPIHTWDTDGFYLPWCEEMLAKGFSSIVEGVGIYSIAMQLVLWFSAIAPFDTAVAIKLFSIVADYIMAAGVAAIVYQLHNGGKQQKRTWAYIAFAAATIMPLPLLNSALWGQSDTIYASFAIWCAYFMVKEKPFAAFVLYGVSFSFKLQAILFLPFLVFMYFAGKKRFSVLQFLVPFGVLFISTLPVVVQGASPFIGLKIYRELTKYDKAFYINYPGLPALGQTQDVEIFNLVGTLFGMLVCFLMLVWLLHNRREVQGENTLLLGAWSVLICAFLLPGMHERYGMIGEVLLWVYFLVKPNKARFLLAALFTFTGYCAYASYLFGAFPIQVEWLVLLNLFGLLWMTKLLVDNLPTKPQEVVPAIEEPAEKVEEVAAVSAEA